VYSAGDYLWMVGDDVRVSAYTGAIGTVVKPGERVLEIGAGFGFFSVVAALSGAAHVHAIDVNPIVHLGPKVAAANGCADRISFQQMDSERLELTSKVDVIVSDLRGATPFSGRSLETLIDARRRFARPDTRFIAATDIVFASPCRAPRAFARRIRPTRTSPRLELAAVERVVFDTPFACAIDRSDLVMAGIPWCRLDYSALERTDHEGELRWTVERDAEIDGIAVWFATDLGGGHGFSTEPGAAGDVYPQTFLPFREPSRVTAGDDLEIRLAARLVRGSYVWEWRAVATQETSRVPRLLTHQNSLPELVVDPDALRAAQAGAAQER